MSVHSVSWYCVHPVGKKCHAVCMVCFNCYACHMRVYEVHWQPDPFSRWYHIPTRGCRRGTAVIALRGHFGAAHHVTCSFILAKLYADMVLSKMLSAQYRRLDTCGYRMVAHTTLYRQRSRSISKHRLLFCCLCGFGPTWKEATTSTRA